jgi:hypothetical protein
MSAPVRVTERERGLFSELANKFNPGKEFNPKIITKQKGN